MNFLRHSWILLFLALCWDLVAHAEVAMSAQQANEQPVLERLQNALLNRPDDQSLRASYALVAEHTAQEAFNRGDVPVAIKILERAKMLLPDNARISKSLANMLMHERQWDRAEIELVRTEHMVGRDRDVSWLLGRLFYATGRLAEAEDVVRRGLETNPDDEQLVGLLTKLRRDRSLEDRMVRTGDGVFIVTYDGGGEEVGQEVLEALSEAYVSLGSQYNFFPEGPISVILYGQKDFTTVIGAPGWSGGLYDGKIRLPVRNQHRMTDDLRAAIFHEYSHVLILNLSRGRAPLWLNEGLAQLAEEHWHAKVTPHWESAILKGRLLRLERMDKYFSSADRDTVGLAYEESYRFVRFLVNQYGETKLLELLTSVAQGNTVSKAVYQVLGLEFNDKGAIARWLEYEGLSNDAARFFRD